MVYIISPHIDDAALSLGGFMLNLSLRNEAFTVENIFTISDWVNPAAINPPYEADAILDQVAVTAFRKAEEELLNEKLRYHSNFWNFFDNPLRKERGNDREELVLIVQDRIQTFLHKEEKCFFPIGMGHPDHLIARLVGLNLLKLGYEIFFYEDMPYSTFGNYDYENHFNFMTKCGFKPFFEKIDIERKMDILKIYSSQVATEWLMGIKNYAYNPIDNAFYERYWRAFNNSYQFIDALWQ